MNEIEMWNEITGVSIQTIIRKTSNQKNSVGLAKESYALFIETAYSDKDGKSTELVTVPSCIQFRLIIVKVEKFRSVGSSLGVFPSMPRSRIVGLMYTERACALVHKPLCTTLHSFHAVEAILFQVHDFRPR